MQVARHNGLPVDGEVFSSRSRGMHMHVTVRTACKTLCNSGGVAWLNMDKQGSEWLCDQPDWGESREEQSKLGQ